jgi:hypothetical protein
VTSHVHLYQSGVQPVKLRADPERYRVPVTGYRLPGSAYIYISICMLVAYVRVHPDKGRSCLVRARSHVRPCSSTRIVIYISSVYKCMYAHRFPHSRFTKPIVRDGVLVAYVRVLSRLRVEPPVREDAGVTYVSVPVVHIPIHRARLLSVLAVAECPDQSGGYRVDRPPDWHELRRVWLPHAFDASTCSTTR